MEWAGLKWKHQEKANWNPENCVTAFLVIFLMDIGKTAGYGWLGVLQWALKSRAENISSILSAHPAIKKADTLTRQQF